MGSLLHTSLPVKKTGESPHSRAAIQLSPASLLPYVPHSPKKWDSIGRHHKTALYNLLVYQLLSIVKSTSAGRAKDARPQRRNAGPTCKTIVDNDAQKLRLPVGIKKNDRHKRRRRRASRLSVCTQHGLVRLLRGQLCVSCECLRKQTILIQQDNNAIERTANDVKRTRSSFDKPHPS
jgi:hypothetical protein